MDTEVLKAKVRVLYTADYLIVDLYYSNPLMVPFFPAHSYVAMLRVAPGTGIGPAGGRGSQP